MSLETALAENTAALKAHTAALLAGGAPATVNAKQAAAPKAEKAKPEAKAEAPAGIDYETQVKPVVIATVKAKGRPAVDTIFEQFGVKSAKEVKPADYQKLLDALAALNAEEDAA